MNEKDQIVHFAKDIDKLVERYRHEYDISYAALLGVLQMKGYLLCQEVANFSKPNETD